MPRTPPLCQCSTVLRMIVLQIASSSVFVIPTGLSSLSSATIILRLASPGSWSMTHDLRLFSFMVWEPRWYVRSVCRLNSTVDRFSHLRANTSWSGIMIYWWSNNRSSRWYLWAIPLSPGQEAAWQTANWNTSILFRFSSLMRNTHLYSFSKALIRNVLQEA